jgi:hypothetical protein
MRSWVDTLAEKAHKAIDWLHDLAARGTRRRARLLKKNREVAFETSLTNLVIATVLAILFLFPVAVLTIVIVWLMGYRIEVDP